MQNQRRYWLVPGIGSFQAKLLGATLGLLAGLLLGGIVLPNNLIAAPITAVGSALSAVVVEYQLQRMRFTPLMPLWGAIMGATSGMVAGAAVGGVTMLLGGIYLALTGRPPVGIVGIPVEAAAVTGIAGLFGGFLLGFGRTKNPD